MPNKQHNGLLCNHMKILKVLCIQIVFFVALCVLQGALVVKAAETTSWLSSEQYQASFNSYMATGYYPKFVQGKLSADGSEVFQGIFDNDYGEDIWRSCHGLDSSAFASADSMYRNMGLYPYWHQTFAGAKENKGILLHQATWLSRDTTRMQVLANNVTVSNIDANPGIVSYYKLILPSGSKYVTISATNNENCLIRANFNIVPTQDSAYTLVGNNLLLEDPPSGALYLTVESSISGRNATLTVSTGSESVIELDPAQGWVEDVEMASSQYKIYKVNVPENTSYLVFLTRGMQNPTTSDVNIIAGCKYIPSLARYEYGSMTQGSDERIVVENPQPGYWYLRLFNDGENGSAGLLAWTGYFPSIDLSPNNYLYGISGIKNHLKSYKFTVPADRPTKGIRISLTGGQTSSENSRVYMFVRHGGIAFFDYCTRSMLNQLKQQVVINDPEPGEWYISLIALDDYVGGRLNVEMSDRLLPGANIGKQLMPLPFIPLLIDY